MLKSYWMVVVGGLQNFSVSPSPLETNWVFELGWTLLGLRSSSPSPSQIQKGKGEFVLWAVTKILWANTTTSNF